MDIVLGVDIGGSGIKAAPVDVQTGELLAERVRLPTPEGAEPEAVLDVLGQLVRHFDHSGPVSGRGAKWPDPECRQRQQELDRHGRRRLHDAGPAPPGQRV